jgi:hypothetical protein
VGLKPDGSDNPLGCADASAVISGALADFAFGNTGTIATGASLGFAGVIGGLKAPLSI